MPRIHYRTNVQMDFDLGADEPWDDNAKVYQPIETEQILLPDKASSLSMQAFLRMCQLSYEVVERENCDEMSPLGLKSARTPFVKCGAFLISEMETLLMFLANKGLSRSGPMDPNVKLELRVYMSLMNTVLVNAELYLTWVDPEMYNQVTWGRYGSMFLWPLNYIVPWKRRRNVHKRLAAFGWLDKTIDEVYEEVDSCFTALSEKLNGNKYFFGNKATEMDAVVFAHVFTILTTPLPSNQLAATVRCYPRLVEHCMRIEEEFFSGPNSGTIRPKLEESPSHPPIEK